MDSQAEFSKRKLWGGRFTGTTDPLMHKFNASINFTKTLYKVDVRQSIAYSKALAKAGILTDAEAKEMERGLKIVEQEWDEGQFDIKADDEDIFTANERRLSEIIGTGIGGKIHTGRSRNDQTATDARLWLIDQIKDIKTYLIDLISVMTNRAEKEVDALMPGYTHLQKAQPVRWSHWLLSHAHALLNDLERLCQLVPRISVLPLGAGAMAGNPYELDRAFLAKELGFQSVGQNSMHMVFDRDFVMEFLQWSSLLTNHFSRLAEDLIIYSSGEFGFVQLSDAYSTGSSIMPQKKNPDSLELLRGKSGRVFGQMAGLMMSMKGIPTTYNKDMQEDKEPMFNCASTVQDCIRIAEGVIATLDINPEKMRAALTEDMLATDLADYLVRKGVPFRTTHHISGRAVALAEQEKKSLSELTFEQYYSLSDKFEKDVHGVFDFESSVEKRNAIGGPSRKGIATQVEYLRTALSKV
ncbi:L-Aspartase-like protein [Naematelia encephala]|uniref:Argininosuccinate lyase n=1 Tax=Naematelia encephala TaxID=71784 RepID=A0A1Y2BM09_9TREE|nr:L-Aspartase-like protein [Naematelia encephala]